MLKYIFVALFLLSIQPIQAQPFQKPTIAKYGDTMSTFYLEIGGNGILGSINYDLILPSNYGIRVGISPGLILFNAEDSESEFSVQNFNFIGILSAFKLHGTSSHKLESGLGIVVGEINSEIKENFPAIPGIAINLGYRFVSKREKGLSLRVMFSPILCKDGFTPWFGGSLGYSFINKRY